VRAQGVSLAPTIKLGQAGFCSWDKPTWLQGWQHSPKSMYRRFLNMELVGIMIGIIGAIIVLAFSLIY